MRVLVPAVLSAALLYAAAVRANDHSPSQPVPLEKGSVRFEPLGDQKNIPERYRLEAHTFSYEMQPLRSLPGCDQDVYRLRFPSPVTSPHPENNTVHADYYRPRGPGPFPCVIVLDITGGDQSISRIISARLAQEHIAALFVQMAYYGPRRPPGSKLRLLTTDIHHTVGAIRQTVLDLRRATAWMASRPEIDSRNLGILGTSLGSFIGSVTAEMEPRLSRVAILLGGGGLVDAYYDDPRAKAARAVWEVLGGSRKKLAEMLAPVDPLTCAANLKDRKVLMLAAKRDEIVPPKMAEAMWKASGKQKIVWYDCTHYGAALYVVPALRQVVEHFRVE
jgi:dienelactone hydrolase